MSTPREKAIVNRIIKALNAIDGVRAIKTHGGAFGRSGQPDITGVVRVGCGRCEGSGMYMTSPCGQCSGRGYQGQRFDLEAKRPGEKPTRIQELEMEKWAEAGSVVGVVTSVEEAMKILGPHLAR